ncbi:amino acid transporter YHC3 [Sporobolomyces salmoneus]|uniref:amino acid transporter YHC3 n=1 Tax=Sporobolomyces salmoneus TaxID=183962 RepID=UPI00317FB6C6
MIPIHLAFGASFFLFGTLNNVLYVVILSAALDLVDKAATPKGLILFVNIAPALLVKVGWPYFVPGQPRYKARIVSCSALSFAGILIVALSNTLFFRLLGISIASFSSGLGEMTYLQCATVYGSLSLPDGIDLGGKAVGWFSSGTGAAGLIGAGLWWILRGLGVRTGLLICSFLPLCMSLTYFFLLPSLASFKPTSLFSSDTPYAPLPNLDAEATSDTSSLLEEDQVMARVERQLEKLPGLTTKEKFELARPLFARFMLPLFFVYLAEYTINSGVAPTLLYEIPNRKDSPVLASMIKNLRDYYPLWQLLYQTFVFISRSSLSIFHLPPLPLSLLPLPTILQLVILALTILESTTSVFVNLVGESGATWITILLVCCEGLCGGAAYVNCFYRLGTAIEEVGQGDEDALEVGGSSRIVKDSRRREQEKEFRIASVGFADTSGILVASLISSALEPRLCRSQVSRGRTHCTEL